jgi:hypothetical protein
MSGKLNVAFYDDEENIPIATVYGDPEGLRSLASILTMLADIDQEKLPLNNLPVGEGYHIHLHDWVGLLEGSLKLDLGRLDERSEG